MAKIDLNAVLDGAYKVRVGNEYEVAPGVSGKLRVPTKKLQDKVFALGKEIEDAVEKGEELKIGDVDICRLVLEGLGDVDEDDLIPQMVAVVVNDFFTLLTPTAQKPTEG